MNHDMAMGENHIADTLRTTRRPVGPRLYHRKSRTGCMRCKTRRVKCDEARPACDGCSRHQMDCIYPTNVSRRRPQQVHQHAGDAGIRLRATRAQFSASHSDPTLLPNAPSATTGSETWAQRPVPDRTYVLYPGEARGVSSVTSGPTHYPATQEPSPPPQLTGSSSSSQAGSVRKVNDYLSHLTDPEIVDIPESKERRIWELRLMHNYMLNQAQQFHGTKAAQHHGPQPVPAGRAFPPGSFLWGREIPLLGLEDDAILYSILASSALSMWAKAADPRERGQLRLVQHKYLSMALREQRRAVGRLGRENADAVCLSSLTILQSSFALVQTLPVRPWQPPLEWLRMGRGAGAVLAAARGYLGPGGGDGISRFVDSTPRMDPDEMFAPGRRAHLAWVLDGDRGGTGAAAAAGDRELQDGVALGVYNRVLSYIGSVQQAIADRLPLYAICRWFIGFAVWMPEIYHDFLTQMRPRALITLAHFFKLWIPYDDLWLIGKTGENQVRGIQEALPTQWRHKLDCIFEEYDLEP